MPSCAVGHKCLVPLTDDASAHLNRAGIVATARNYPLHSSTWAPILLASSRPPFPVTAFAQPELTTIARIPFPCLFCNISLVTCTEAAWNLFVVKTAAAEHGVSEHISATSGKWVFDVLTPAWVAETRKPFGYVPSQGTNLCLTEGIEP